MTQSCVNNTLRKSADHPQYLARGLINAGLSLWKHPQKRPQEGMKMKNRRPS